MDGSKGGARNRVLINRRNLLQLLPRGWGNEAPEVWTFGRMVQARSIRVWPHHVPHSTIWRSNFLRAELLGCEPGMGRAAGEEWQWDGSNPQHYTACVQGPYPAV